MKLRFNFFTQLLFPASHDELCIAACREADFMQKLQAQHSNDILTLAPFTDPQVRAAIHLCKFHFNPHATALLRVLLREGLLQHTDMQKTYILIPVPLSRPRLRKRGYNQTAEIAKKGLPDHVQLHEDVLVRTRNTKPQTSLERTQRLHNLKDAFALASGKEAAVYKKHVILFDDVSTTGATLRAATDALKRHRPASVLCVALAH